MIPSHTTRPILRRAQALLVLIAASTAWTPLSATDLKFEKASDLERNFAKPTVKDVLSVEKADGGVLRFATGDKPRLVRTAYAQREKPVNLVNEKITAKIRFKQPQASFGLMTRVQQELTDCYVTLVNIGPKGGTLRIFKGQPHDSYAQGALVVSQSSGIKPGEWYRLETSVTNKANSVLVQTEIKPGNGGRAIMTAEYEDKSEPLNKPGHLQLRFFSGETGGEIDVKELSIKGDAK